MSAQEIKDAMDRIHPNNGLGISSIQQFLDRMEDVQVHLGEETKPFWISQMRLNEGTELTNELVAAFIFTVLLTSQGGT